uniref:Zinc finger protein 287-like n=1 Tax=Labrus bergylta TaxID=56723 RepID=A0A3Q3G1M7_9LABR|nr:zinc finger protein 287-like [Labrus bergylta]
MSPRSLLRTFVNERLTAAAEEIFQVFEGAIAKYEEEATSSMQEIERLRCLLLETNQNKDHLQLSICKEESVPEPHEEPSLSVCQKDPEPPHIKEEDKEIWASEQQETQSYRASSSTWETNEQRDIKPPLQPQNQNRESEQFQEPQATETIHFMLPLPSTLLSQTLIRNGRVQDGWEGEDTTARSTSNQTQTDQSQRSYTALRDSTHVSDIHSVANDTQLSDKPFSSDHDLINHACLVNSKDKGVPCVVCGQSFESTESLNVHLKSHKGTKCCHVCGKRCNDRTTLTDHMASHAGVKLHRCHVCGKECSRKGDLKIHMRFHTGEKPYFCSFCGKSFTHSGHLRKHMRSHTGERPHQCDICGRGFLQRVHLKDHLVTHAPKY